MVAHVIHSGRKMPDSKKEPVSIRKFNEPHGEWIWFESKTAAAENIEAAQQNLSKVLAGKRKHTRGWTARREPKPEYSVADGCKKCRKCWHVWEKKFFWSDLRHKEVGRCYICTQKAADRRMNDPVYREIAELWAEYKRQPCVDCGETSEFIEADHVYGPAKWIWQKKKKKMEEEAQCEDEEKDNSSSSDEEDNEEEEDSSARKAAMRKKKINLSNISWWAENGGVAAWMQEAMLTQPRRMDYHRIRTRRWHSLKKELLAAAERRTVKRTGATEQKSEKCKWKRRYAKGVAHINARKREVGTCQCDDKSCKKRVQPGMEFLFDFDHRDPAKKTACIGHMVMYSEERRETEMGACRLLYCICHAAHTRNQNAERIAGRMKAIAEMEQVKAVASTMDTLIATLTDPLGPPTGPPAAPASASALASASAPAPAVQAPTSRAPKRRRLLGM